MSKYLSLLAAAGLAFASPISPRQVAVGTVTTLHQSAYTFFENQWLLDNGELLISTLSSPSIYKINPNSPSPALTVVATFPNVQRATGIAPVGLKAAGKFAAVGGNENGWVLDDPVLNIFKLDGTIVDSIPGPSGASLLNGLIQMPLRPNVLLSADSVNGRIIRWNTLLRTATTVVTDPALAGGYANPAEPLPLGVNGIKICGQYLYFTNTFQGTFGRFKINLLTGAKTGPVEILVQLTLPTGFTNAFDDFTFDDAGNAYVTQHLNTVIKVTPAGVVSVVPGTGNFASPILTPTSVAVSADQKNLYVTTGMSEYSSGGIFSIRIAA
ncbi:hypothetical protein V8F06_005426 [Rhypophila decipiens]